MADYALVKKQDFFFDLLCKRLGSLDDRASYNLISGAQIHILPEVSDSSWNNEYSVGHGVHFYVPYDIFLTQIDMLDASTEVIRDELRRIYRYPYEYIDSVVILAQEETMAPSTPSSPFYYTQNKLPSFNDADTERIWGNGSLRVFISHRDAEKIEARNIQKQLEKFNIASFVAHEDIKPTEEWTKEILRALMSMDVLLTLMTDTFFDSIWTNQEIGFALGRNIPVIPIKVKNNIPCGFVSILQAHKHSSSCGKEILSLLLKTQSFPASVKNATIASLAKALCEANSFSSAETLAAQLDYVDSLNPEQAMAFIEAFNTNAQIKGCMNLSGYDAYGKYRKKGTYAPWLSRCTGKNFIIKQKHLNIILIEDAPQAPASTPFRDVPF